MGRYYNGDIEGKFWFGIQSSVCANQFGVKADTDDVASGFVYYHFTQDDLETVQEGLLHLFKIIGGVNMRKLDDFWEDCSGYNDQILKDGGVFEIWEDLQKPYTDFEVGEKIFNCLLIQDECNFWAEL